MTGTVLSCKRKVFYFLFDQRRKTNCEQSIETSLTPFLEEILREEAFRYRRILNTWCSKSSFTTYMLKSHLGGTKPLLEKAGSLLETSIPLTKFEQLSMSGSGGSPPSSAHTPRTRPPIRGSGDSQLKAPTPHDIPLHRSLESIQLSLPLQQDMTLLVAIASSQSLTYLITK